MNNWSFVFFSAYKKHYSVIQGIITSLCLSLHRMHIENTWQNYKRLNIL